MTPEPTLTSPLELDPAATRLLWHILHLNNTILSQLGAYLSLEALHRDALFTSLIVPTPHYPLMQSQAVMMADGCRNLDAAVDALGRLPAYGELMGKESTKAVFVAAGVIIKVESGVSNREEVEALRKAYDEMVELCYGDAKRGVRGWKEAWNEIFGYSTI
ncbi:hypothetical protein B0A55_00813 [Friedmanniomyces simplex]|uniref:Uncharacterized protein n=1 Tax=Friedmanniomyces simplex TaxID=329884 RepID=A0A4U0XZ07_9PEZI|nr:hypothetical protein B0A55_00813 [Friedmanniomyces simplex]